jgi:hypothetical protein
MKTFLILFFLGYDGTLTFYQAETFASREQCEQLNAHVNFDAYGDEFQETWSKCLTKDEIAGELNAR